MNFRSRQFKIGIAAIIVLIIIGASTGAMIQYQASQVEITLIEFDYERAYGDEDALTSIGPRAAATDGEYKGAEYVKSQFEAAGLENVGIEQFEILAFEVYDAEVSLIPYGPLGRFPDPLSSPITFQHKIDFVAQGHSGSRSWSNFMDDLEVQFVGNGSDDATFAQAEGKAAIVDGGTGSWSTNTDLFFKADKYNVEALILHNTNEHKDIGYVPYFKGTGLPEGKTSYPDDIPFFMVSKEAGDLIRAAPDSNQRIRIMFDVVVEKRMTSVTVGDVVGTENPDEYVMFGAHMDTVYNGPGAIDNTVGTVTVIELARQFAKTKPKTTIRLATFGAEEIGIWGSRLYWAAHEAELKGKVKFYFNFDMNHASPETMRLVLLSDSNKLLESLEPYEDMMKDKHANLDRYTVQYELRDPFPGNSDHYIFEANDVPFFVCFGSGSQGYHSYKDTIDQFNGESLAVSAIIFGSYGLMIANK